MKSYWIKDESRQQIITKTPIPNKGNFKVYANYYNFIDAKGLGFSISDTIDIEVEKLFVKEQFQYLVLEQNQQKELYILPNERMTDYVNNVALQLNHCQTEADVIRLLFSEMY